MKLSNSRLEVLERCPRFFDLAYLQGLPTVETAPAIVGNVLHDIFAMSLRALKEQRDKYALDTPRELFRAASHLIPPADYQDAEDMIDYYCDTPRFRVNPDELIGVEMEFAVDWNGNPVDVRDSGIGTVDGFRGKLDRVMLVRLDTGGYKLVITDWKTGWIPPVDDALHASHQLLRYGFLALQEWPHVEMIEVELEYLRLKRKYPTKPLILDMARLRDTTWPAILAAKKQVEERMAANDWPYKVGTQCGFCRFDCPSRGTPVECKAPQTEDEARKLAQEIVAYESAIEERTFRLQMFLEQNMRRFEEAGRFWSTESTAGTVYNWPQLAAIAKSMGLDPDKLLRPPTDSEVKKWLGKNKDLAKAAEPLAQTKYGDPIFGGRKRKPAGWPD